MYLSIRIRFNVKKGVGNEKERQLSRYLFYVYHKRSQFYHMEKRHRRASVSRDVLGSETMWEKAESQKIIKSVISDLHRYQFTESESLLHRVREKVSEFIKYSTEEDIKNENSFGMKSKIKDANELVKMRKELEQEIFKDLAHSGDVDSEKDSFIERIMTDKKRIYEKILSENKNVIN
jgi:hypothetical protein